MLGLCFSSVCFFSIRCYHTVDVVVSPTWPPVIRTNSCSHISCTKWNVLDVLQCEFMKFPINVVLQTKVNNILSRLSIYFVAFVFPFFFFITHLSQSGFFHAATLLNKYLAVRTHKQHSNIATKNTL